MWLAYCTPRSEWWINPAAGQTPPEPASVLGRQNYYCANQKQNPHTVRVMKFIGLNADDVDRFCSDTLFPIEL
jgi:hypothetical protein